MTEPRWFVSEPLPFNTECKFCGAGLYIVTPKEYEDYMCIECYREGRNDAENI